MKTRRILAILLTILCVAQSPAVLREKDLARTLGVLRAELQMSYEKQKQFMAMYEQQGATQHQRLVNYMHKCEQIRRRQRTPSTWLMPASKRSTCSQS